MSTFAASDVVRLSTDALPVRDRLPFWTDAFGHAIARMQFDPVPGRPFRQAVSMRALDDLGLMLGETDGIRSRRSGALLADGCDDLVLTTNLLGFSLVTQLGHELKLDAGTAVMVTSAEAGSQDFPETGRFLTLRIPRRALAHLVADLESALMRVVPGNAEALRLLVDYVATMSEKHDLATPRIRQLFSTHVHDLVALAIGATRDASEVAQGRGLRAARLNAIKADIVARLADERLSVTETAKRHRVTPRYVHVLFEAEGRTFSEFVIAQRIARAHRMLTDTSFADRTVSAIAFDVGFANLSYFNRTFRRRYGATPSDVRETAQRGSSR